MSWQTIAKKDIRDSMRARTLWAIVGGFLLLLLAWAWLLTDWSDADSVEAFFGGAFLIALVLFVPLTGLFISIKSIVRERESGTINLLLSLPHTRREMIIGKFVGRSAVLTASILAGLLPVTIVALFRADGTPLFEVFSVLVTTVLIGLMFVGIGLGLSALVGSETRATIGGVLTFVLLFVWEPMIVSNLSDPPDFIERFYLIFMWQDMNRAIQSLNDSDIGSASVVEIGLNDEAPVAASSVLMQHWFAFIILAVWIAVPLALGYLRFESTDL